MLCLVLPDFIWPLINHVKAAGKTSDHLISCTQQLKMEARFLLTYWWMDCCSTLSQHVQMASLTTLPDINREASAFNFTHAYGWGDQTPSIPGHQFMIVINSIEVLFSCLTSNKITYFPFNIDLFGFDLFFRREIYRRTNIKSDRVPRILSFWDWMVCRSPTF